MSKQTNGKTKGNDNEPISAQRKEGKIDSHLRRIWLNETQGGASQSRNRSDDFGNTESMNDKWQDSSLRSE